MFPSLILLTGNWYHQKASSVIYESFCTRLLVALQSFNPVPSERPVMEWIVSRYIIIPPWGRPDHPSTPKGTKSAVRGYWKTHAENKPQIKEYPLWLVGYNNICTNSANFTYFPHPQWHNKYGICTIKLLSERYHDRMDNKIHMNLTIHHLEFEHTTIG